ncbi:MAG TPA: hypothetical protein VJ743_24105, partial [Albitalea sp.]|nr:hypothetical protein [Albitalea sp.]
GSDVQGELDLASPTDLDDTIFGTVQPGLESDSDSAGTGERGAALPDEQGREANDILPDEVQRIPGGADFDDAPTDEELDLLEGAAAEEAGDESDIDQGADQGRS